MIQEYDRIEIVGLLLDADLDYAKIVWARELENEKTRNYWIIFIIQGVVTNGRYPPDYLDSV